MELAVDKSKQSERGGKASPQLGSAAKTESQLHPALQLQQQAGNQAVQQLLRSGAIRAKLSISQPCDPEEQEADATADRIMRSHTGIGAAAVSCSCGTDEEGMCDECRQKAAGISRNATETGPARAPHQALGAMKRSAGHPLDATARAFFEPRFGRDFSHVRVHTDSLAEQSATAIRANAFALDSDLFFAAGRYAPESEAGRRLLAHELTHVLQRGSADEIRRQDDGGAPQATPGAAIAPALLHQIGLSAIDTYYAAAVRGIDLFVRDMSGSFNWAAFWGGLAGNLIWAAACFETGGTAFAISIGGIGLGTRASLASPTPEGFSATAEAQTNELVKLMRNQVSAKSDEVAAEGSAATPAWDENRTRLELLRRIGFRRDEIVVATGGLPDVDAATITAKTRAALLLKANAEHMGVIGVVGGDAIYKYDLSNYLESHYWGITHSAKPVSQWQASLHSEGVLLFEGGDDALANIRRGNPGPLHIADWPIEKTIVVPADTTRRLQLEYVMIHLDAKNQIRSVEVEGVFKDYIVDNSISRDDYARQIIAKLWGSSTSPPPDIP